MALILGMTEVLTAPPIGDFIGTTGHEHIVRHMNESAGSRVIFGDNDPLKTQYQYFRDAIINRHVETLEIIEDSLGDVLEENSLRRDFITIVDDDDVENISDAMKLELLSYKPIYDRVMKGHMYGWGIDMSEVRTDNPWERIINNGYVEFDKIVPKGEGKAEFKWEWWSDDPKPSFDMETVATMRETIRGYVDPFLEKELHGSEDSEEDPRDFTNGFAPMTL